MALNYTITAILHGRTITVKPLLYMCLYGISMLLQSWVHNYKWACPFNWDIYIFTNKNKWGVSFFAIFRKVTFLSLFVILIVGFQCKIKYLESIWDHPVSRLNSNIRFLKLLLEFSGKRKEVEINQSISLSHLHIHTHTNTLLMLSVFCFSTHKLSLPS